MYALSDPGPGNSLTDSQPTLAPGNSQQAQGMYQENLGGSPSVHHQAALLEPVPARPVFEYEVSEVEERDAEMVDR